MSRATRVSPAVQIQTVKFSNANAAPFIREMKRRVNAYFKAEGLSKHADGRMIRKTIAMLALTFVPYGLIMSGSFGPWAMLGFCVVMGIGTAGCGFSIAHDALHGAYTKNRAANAVLDLSFDVLGGSGYFWKITHNVIHHTYTNIHGIDEDLEVSPFIRLSPNSEHRPIHRMQHFFAFAAYSVSTLYWVLVKDYKILMLKHLGPYKGIEHPRREIVKLFAMKLLYYGYVIVLPLLVLDVAWWQFVIGFVVMHLTAGLILGVVFQLAHVVEGPEHFAVGEQDEMEDAWLVHEMKTTANFGRSNKLLCWYVGGLNFQIEHHLFPRICSIHYPAISPIVEAVAKEHGVPYHHHPTLRAAIASHYRMLKRLGRSEALPAA